MSDEHLEKTKYQDYGEDETQDIKKKSYLASKGIDYQTKMERKYEPITQLEQTMGGSTNPIPVRKVETQDKQVSKAPESGWGKIGRFAKGVANASGNLMFNLQKMDNNVGGGRGKRPRRRHPVPYSSGGGSVFGGLDEGSYDPLGGISDYEGSQFSGKGGGGFGGLGGIQDFEKNLGGGWGVAAKPKPYGKGRKKKKNRVKRKKRGHGGRSITINLR